MDGEQKSILYVKRENNSLKSRKAPFDWKGVFLLHLLFGRCFVTSWVVYSKVAAAMQPLHSKFAIFFCIDIW